MTSPAIFESGSYFRETSLVTTTATIVTDFRAVAVTSAGWSEPSANLFKSPVDANSRFMDILLTEISTTRLGWRVRDQNAVTICDRAFDIGASVTMNYFIGQHFAVVTNITGAELGQAFMLSLEPESQTVHANYTVATASRSSAGTGDSNGDSVGEYFAIDNVAAAVQNRLIIHNSNAVIIPLINFSGALRYIPCVSQALFDATNRRVQGALYNAVLVDSGQLFASLHTISIGDAGETGDFKVQPLVTIQGIRMAVRKGTTV